VTAYDAVPVRAGEPPGAGAYWLGLALVLAFAAIALLCTGAPGPVGAAALTALLWLPLGIRRLRQAELSPVIFLLVSSTVASMVFLSTSAQGQSRRGELVLYGISTGCAIALAAILALDTSVSRNGRPSSPATRKLDVLVTLGIPLAALGAVVGWAYGHPQTYLLGDVFKLCATAATYLIVVRTFRDRQQIRILVPVVAVTLLVQQAGDLWTLVTQFRLGEVYRLTSPLWIQNFAAVVAFWVLALSSRRMATKFLSLTTLLLLLAVGLGGGLRTYLGLVLLIALLPLALSSRRAVKSYVGVLPVLAIFVIPVGTVTITTSETAAQSVSSAIGVTANRFSQWIRDRDSEPAESSHQRRVEVEIVLSDLKQNPIGWVTGFGAGAKIKLTGSASPEALARHSDDGYRVHHIHNTVAAYLYRFGLLGGLYICALMAFAGFLSLRIIRSAPDALSWFAPLVVAGYLLASPFFLLIPGDIVFALCLGLLAVDSRSRVSAPAPSSIPGPSPEPASGGP
jgi:O-antigen ligase